MGLIRNFRLRQRASTYVFNTMRFASRLREDLSEFAPSFVESVESMGDELAIIARDACNNEKERGAILEGLAVALRALDLSIATQTHIVARLRPRILSGEPTHVSNESWQRIAM
jgi:hypothetical protein